ncbi:MAG: hypothetical protein Q9212_001181 [Teloschistes hypoglaucus]
MPYNLKGRNVLITGASRGLGVLIAERFAAEGSNVAINYNASEDRAKQVAEKIKKTTDVKVIIDQGILADCENTVQKTIDGLGGIDIIVSNAVSRLSPHGSISALKSTVCRVGPSLPNSMIWMLCPRKNGIRLAVVALGSALFVADVLQCWAVNCKGNLHLLRKALPTFNANPDGGIYLMTSSIAGINPSGSTMAYSVTKAAGPRLEIAGIHVQADS